MKLPLSSIPALLPAILAALLITMSATAPVLAETVATAKLQFRNIGTSPYKIKIKNGDKVTHKVTIPAEQNTMEYKSIDFKFTKCKVSRERTFTIYDKEDRNKGTGHFTVSAVREKGKCQAKIDITSCTEFVYVNCRSITDRKARITLRGN